MLLSIHIAAGGLAIVLGAVALSVKKGGPIHRRIGTLFVYAMLVMGVTAGILGALAIPPTIGNVYAGIMVAYFVVTAVTTVRPPTPWTRRINVAGLVVALGLALSDILAGLEAFNSPGGVRNGVPFFMLCFLAAIFILAAIGDVRVMRFGMPRGGPRLARHLWRMCADAPLTVDVDGRPGCGSIGADQPGGRITREKVLAGELSIRTPGTPWAWP